MTVNARFKCACGAQEAPLAQNCTIALRAGRPAFVAPCGSTGRPFWLSLTADNLELMLNTPVLLDPDVRDYLRREGTAMSLCPESGNRAAMTDDEFWDHAFQVLDVRTSDAAPVDELPSLDEVSIDADPCPVCGEVAACAYDAEGRPLIHTLPPERGEDS